MLFDSSIEYEPSATFSGSPNAVAAGSLAGSLGGGAWRTVLKCTDPAVRAAAEQSVKQLRTLQHPNILRVVDFTSKWEGGKSDTGCLLAKCTPAASPLPTVLPSLGIAEILLGVSSIAEAASFLEQQAHLALLSVDGSQIFVASPTHVKSPLGTRWLFGDFSTAVPLKSAAPHCSAQAVARWAVESIFTSLSVEQRVEARTYVKLTTIIKPRQQLEWDDLSVAEKVIFKKADEALLLLPSDPLERCEYLWDAVIYMFGGASSPVAESASAKRTSLPEKFSHLLLQIATMQRESLREKAMKRTPFELFLQHVGGSDALARVALWCIGVRGAALAAVAGGQPIVPPLSLSKEALDVVTDNTKSTKGIDNDIKEKELPSEPTILVSTTSPALLNGGVVTLNDGTISFLHQGVLLQDSAMLSDSAVKAPTTISDQIDIEARIIHGGFIGGGTYLVVGVPAQPSQCTGPNEVEANHEVQVQGQQETSLENQDLKSAMVSSIEQSEVETPPVQENTEPDTDEDRNDENADNEHEDSEKENDDAAEEEVKADEDEDLPEREDDTPPRDCKSDLQAELWFRVWQMYETYNAEGGIREKVVKALKLFAQKPPSALIKGLVRKYGPEPRTYEEFLVYRAKFARKYVAAPATPEEEEAIDVEASITLSLSPPLSPRRPHSSPKKKQQTPSFEAAANVEEIQKGGSMTTSPIVAENLFRTSAGRAAAASAHSLLPTLMTAVGINPFAHSSSPQLGTVTSAARIPLITALNMGLLLHVLPSAAEVVDDPKLISSWGDEEEDKSQTTDLSLSFFVSEGKVSTYPRHLGGSYASLYSALRLLSYSTAFRSVVPWLLQPCHLAQPEAQPLFRRYFAQLCEPSIDDAATAPRIVNAAMRFLCLCLTDEAWGAREASVRGGTLMLMLPFLNAVAASAGSACGPSPFPPLASHDASLREDLLRKAAFKIIPLHVCQFFMLPDALCCLCLLLGLSTYAEPLPPAQTNAATAFVAAVGRKLQKNASDAEPPPPIVPGTVVEDLCAQTTSNPVPGMVQPRSKLQQRRIDEKGKKELLTLSPEKAYLARLHIDCITAGILAIAQSCCTTFQNEDEETVLHRQILLKRFIADAAAPLLVLITQRHLVPAMAAVASASQGKHPSETTGTQAAALREVYIGLIHAICRLLTACFPPLRLNRTGQNTTEDIRLVTDPQVREGLWGAVLFSAKFGISSARVLSMALVTKLVFPAAWPPLPDHNSAENEHDEENPSTARLPLHTTMLRLEVVGWLLPTIGPMCSVKSEMVRGAACDLLGTISCIMMSAAKMEALYFTAPPQLKEVDPKKTPKDNPLKADGYEVPSYIGNPSKLAASVVADIDWKTPNSSEKTMGLCSTTLACRLSIADVTTGVAKQASHSLKLPVKPNSPSLVAGASPKQFKSPPLRATEPSMQDTLLTEGEFNLDPLTAAGRVVALATAAFRTDPLVSALLPPAMA